MTAVGRTEQVDALREVLVGELADIGRRFSRLIADIVPHAALVIFTRECTGRPRKVAGDPAIVDRVTITELDSLRGELAPGTGSRRTARIAGRDRDVLAILDRTDTLLVLVLRDHSRPDVDTVRALFGVVATGITLQVGTASPAYLAESRAASAERARTIAELTEVHATTLETILATLRSTDLDDARARSSARETASAALVGLRAAVDVHRDLAEEAVATAFARLRGELRTLIRHRDVALELVEPPVGGRALPGEVAHGARAVVRGAVLALSDQTRLQRIRVAWECDDDGLVVDIRDDGEGEADVAGLAHQLQPRVVTLGGSLETESTTGWGSHLCARFPLTVPAPVPDQPLLATLAPREVEVLGHLVAGRRNRTIAERLGVSESTVKFHVASVLRKLAVQTRGEAAAVGAQSGVEPAP
ncbi:helix-turn-helix transcriptional regulator [Rhodococcus triatomae]|uniref:helix-turn-helix transcriptional regulator n=1 Tax=Rhodococcus triatomae TaxID=300028 RepID=UPI0009341351